MAWSTPPYLVSLEAIFLSIHYEVRKLVAVSLSGEPAAAPLKT
jgi:hypothetical protein